MRMKVVLPVPFSPSMTTIWELENSPAATLSLKVEEPLSLPVRVLTMAGYL